MVVREIYIGLSGIGLFLVELFRVTQNPKYLSYAERAALWLRES
jgi:hypothetical protein